MGLQAEVAAGNLELAIDTALGTISCTMDPVVMAGQVLRAAQSLQEATVAAGMCEVICKDIQDTAINRLPVVCELLRLGQLFPEAEGAANLNKAMLQCFKSVCDALHEARTAMYAYLQCNALTRLRQAASVKELMNERRWQLKNRFDDVNSYMSLANLLRSQQSAEQAQHTAAEVRGLQQQVEDLQRVRIRSADRAQVMALAQACAARQTPKGQKVRVSKSPLNAVAVSPSGEAFATAAADDGAVVTWDTASGTRVRELRRCEKRSSMFPSSSSSRKVKPFISVAWSPAADGSRVAAGSSDGTAMVWNAATGTREHELQMHSDPVYSVAWSPDGSRLATGSGGAVAAIWDATTGTRTHELRGHDKAVWSVAWRPDGSSLATGSDDMIVVVWDAATGTCIHKLRGHGDHVHSVAWSPVWSSVAMASDHVDAVMWNMATGTSMHELLGHSVLVSSDPIAWSPNGSKVAMASRDKTAVVRDTATGTRIHELWGHSEDVRSVAWGRDGDLVLTASQDGTVRIYSLAGRKG